MILQVYISNIEEVCRNLHNCESKTFRSGMRGCVGYLRNLHGGKNCDLKVEITNYSVKICGTSLCKWFYGDNFHTLTLNDIRQCVAIISERLGLPMGKARITRLDIGHNIIVDHKPELYLNHLGAMSRHTRYRMPNGGLYYVNSMRKFVLYDKVREQKCKRNRIPEGYQNCNVLRLELRLLKKIAENFKRKDLTANMLCTEEFYCACVDLWVQYYMNIDPLNDLVLDFSRITTKTEFATLAIAHFAEQIGGQLPLIERLEEERSKGTLTSKQKYDLVKSINDACKSPLISTESELAELTPKVSEAAEYLRNGCFSP